MCYVIFFCKDASTTEILTDGHPLSLHDAAPIYALGPRDAATAPRTCGAGHLGAEHPRHGSRPAPAAPRRTGGGAREAPRKSGASSEMRRLDIISAADGDGRSGIDADHEIGRAHV